MRRWVAARSGAFWIVAGLTVLAAALRFATLDVQSYHHDEVVTASRILREDFWHAMDAVGFSESAPPLYYALAWLWTQLTGTGEYGLRSLSAIAGVATVPVAYLFGRALRGRRAGIAAAALVAVNPMMLWYSQEARAYALLVLLCTASAVYFVRALDEGRRRDLGWWGLFSGLALATHYFAVFPIALEALWLAWKRGRQALAGISIVALFGLALAPLAYHQMSSGHAEWIAEHALSHRAWETVATFFVGETGDIIAQPENPLNAIVPFALALVAVLLVWVRGSAEERRRATIPLLLAGAATVIPLAIAIASPGKDFVLARNLIAALVPLLAAIAVGVTLDGARRVGIVVGAALIAYSLAFSVVASVSPSLQRPDWRAVAERLGTPEQPRAIVTWSLGQASLRRYRAEGSFQAFQSERYEWRVHEVDFVSDGPAPPPPAGALAPGFRQVAYERVGDRLYIRRYALPGPDLGPLKLREAREADLNFRSNAVLIDGVGAG
ncbi:MAG TPA: glycosyltransferase family 39 protein [Solirubrobacterales bacterium]